MTTERTPEPGDLGPACKEIRCEWATVPHVHEGVEVYPLPPDRPEWALALLTADQEFQA